MKRFGKWIIWLVILEFLFFFALGTRMRRKMEQPRVHYVQVCGPASTLLA
jgi:hypothetical protein